MNEGGQGQEGRKKERETEKLEGMKYGRPFGGGQG
jgi:hypothetical protein